MTQIGVNGRIEASRLSASARRRSHSAYVKNVSKKQVIEVSIVVGSSVLRSVWKIRLQGGAMNTVFVRTHGATVRVEKK